VAGAAFGEVQVSLFVAGAALGEVHVSLFVAGVAFGEVQVQSKTSPERKAKEEPSRTPTRG